MKAPSAFGRQNHMNTRSTIGNRITKLLTKLLLVLFAAILLMSCEKLLIEKDPENTPINNFELLWETIDRKYSFFTYKNINWDSLYHEYRPRVHNRMTNRQLFNLMADLLFHLKDGHVNLESGFDRSGNWEWYKDAPNNFNYSLLRTFYLKGDYVRTGPFVSKVIDSIGYVYIGSFSERVKPEHIDSIIKRFYGLKGIVFDVRSNGGGYSTNVGIVAGRFSDRRRLAAYKLFKTGPGHDDFTDPQPVYLSPAGKKQFLKPVTVLTNRRSYSASNDFVLKMSSLPHVTIVGDTTGGGGGTPVNAELLNGWTYRFSATMTLAPDKFNVEHGIAPDIKVNMSQRDINRGIDTILETALEYIRNK